MPEHFPGRPFLSLAVHLASVVAMLALAVWGIWVARPAWDKQQREEQEKHREAWRRVRAKVGGAE